MKHSTTQMTSTTTSIRNSTTAEDLILFKTICADFEDILSHDLHDTFSKLLQRPYLGLIASHDSLTTSSTQSTITTTTATTTAPRLPLIAHEKLVRGIVWGASLRLIISLSVQLTDSILTLSGTRFPIHVHFLYLPASPQTYLSDEVLHTLGIEDMVVVGEHSIAPMSTPLDPVTADSFSNTFANNPFASCHNNNNNSDNNSSCGGMDGVGGNGYSSSLLRLPLRINGYTTMVARSPSDGHFPHLNILGQDFVQLSGANVFFGGQIPRFEISFR